MQPSVYVASVITWYFVGPPIDQSKCPRYHARRITRCPGAKKLYKLNLTPLYCKAPPGPKRINTLWGTQVRDHARMCIPDLNVLIDYPIDFRFPAFGWTRRGELTSSGFFPADPKSLHQAKLYIQSTYYKHWLYTLAATIDRMCLAYFKL